MKVLMVSANYYPVMGGVETHIHEVAPRLVQAGVEVAVLTTDRSGRLAGREVMDGIPVRRVPAWPRSRDYYLAPHLYREIGRERWDLVHCQGFHTFVPPVAMLASLRRRIPYVLTFHSGGHTSAVRNWVRGMQRLALRPLLARAERLIAVSRFEADLYRRALRLPAERFVTIPNGASLPAPANPVVPDANHPLILSAGRLERYKGHHRVIEAFPHVMRAFPTARLRIAGSGPFEDELRGLVTRLGLDDHVEVRAVDPHDRTGMADLLSGSRLVVLLSEFEANPVAVMEALGLGRPVLAADTSGLHDLAEDGVLTAIPIDSTAAQVGAAIVAELRAPPRTVDVALPTWDGCARALLAVYRDVARS